MRHINLILVVIFCVGKTKSDIKLNQVEESSVFPEIVVKILKKHFSNIRKMSVRTDNHYEQSEEVTNIIRSVKIPVTINAPEVILEMGLDTREPSEVVLLMEETLNVSEHLNSNLWTDETYFVMVLKDANYTEADLMESFKTFYQSNIVRVIVVLADAKKVSMYGYIPFGSDGCEKLKIYPIDIKSISLISKTRLTNLHGCMLNVSGVDLPPTVIYPTPESRNGTFYMKGIEPKIIYEISKKLNFVPRFAVARDGEAWGWIHPSPKGVVGEVFTKHSHFGFGLLATTLERYERLDMTVPVSAVRECITWAVPIGAAKTQATWVEIYVTEFSFIMWCCIAVILGVGSITFWLITKALSSSAYIQVLIYMFSAFINVPVKCPDSTPLRSLFLGWVWYSFIVVISYQSLMGSQLTVPYRPRDINTIRDLLESELHFTGFYNTFRLVTYGAEGDLKKVVSRLEPTTYGMKEAINRILYDRNIAYMRETTSFKYYTIINPDAKGNVHFMEECAYQYYPIMVLQRNSPLTSATNKIIARLFESGILFKWRNHYIYEVIIPPPSAIQLTLRHMLGPFVALIFGCIMSVCVFIFERCFSRVKKNDWLEMIRSRRTSMRDLLRS